MQSLVHLAKVYTFLVLVREPMYVYIESPLQYIYILPILKKTQ